MKLNTAARIFLSMLFACVLVLGVNGIAGRISFERAFLGYINQQGVQRMQQIAANVASEYQVHGSWTFLEGRPEAWFRLIHPAGTNAGGAASRPPPVSDLAGVIPRLALFDGEGRRLLGNPAADTADAIRAPVAVEGRHVGWLAMVPLEKAIDPSGERFYQAQQRAWWLNIAVSVAVAALLAWLLSRLLVRRLRALTDGIYQLAAGDYTARIVDRGGDEVARVVQDVNRLAEVLEHTEQSRRDFMADISHELRTPLAVLRAEMEAIEDGIRPMRPDSLAPLQGQVRQLGKLVEDLHELALTQVGPSYQLASIDVVVALDAALTSMAQRLADAGLELLPLDLPGMPLLVLGDERRLRQLFVNLLENTQRYTDRGGQLRVSARAEEGRAVIVIDDSAPGVAEDKRARLFERFYRIETSRSRTSGGSGLGLAICTHIVQAHRGSIHAEASPLGGLRVIVSLPLLP